MKDFELEYEQKKNPARWGLTGSLCLGSTGLVQFIICSLISINYFPSDEKLSDYMFSELGRSTLEYSSLFNGSLIFFGLSLIPMLIYLLALDSRQSFTMRLATGLGIVSALGIALIGLAPVDRNYFGHLASVALWLFPMLYMVVPFFFSASRHPQVSFWFIATSLVMVVGMLAVLLGKHDSDYRLVQKMLVMCGCVWLVFIIWYIGQVGFREIAEWEPTSQERVDKESESYADDISRKKTTRHDHGRNWASRD
ncbi:MAG: hypothetical protein R3C03_12650 [Pirellulaceae bacterium]